MHGGTFGPVGPPLLVTRAMHGQIWRGSRARSQGSTQVPPFSPINFRILTDPRKAEGCTTSAGLFSDQPILTHRAVVSGHGHNASANPAKLLPQPLGRDVAILVPSHAHEELLERGRVEAGRRSAC